MSVVVLPIVLAHLMLSHARPDLIFLEVVFPENLVLSIDLPRV